MTPQGTFKLFLIEAVLSYPHDDGSVEVYLPFNLQTPGSGTERKIQLKVQIEDNF